MSEGINLIFRIMRLKNVNTSQSCHSNTFNQISRKLSSTTIYRCLIQKLLSEKGKPIFVYAGYIYTVERTTTTKVIFRLFSLLVVDYSEINETLNQASVSPSFC